MTPLSTKLFLSIFLSALLGQAIAQVSFDKGYIIDNEGKKIECLIENKDRLMTPRTFQYKLSENESPQQVSVENVKEFEIYNYSHYVSASVEIDTSSSVVGRYNSSKKPAWKKETIFLKVLVDGKAVLYQYEALDLVRFFFKTEANPSIRQLVYKEYFISDGSFGENVTFRQQLLVEVNCGNIHRAHFEQMDYRLDELKKHFIKYNICMGGGEIIKTEAQSKPTQKRNILNFSIAPGFNYSSLTLSNGAVPAYNVALGGDFYFRLGLQIEYMFPFNRNKWSVFIEPTYQTYHASTVYNNRNPTGNSQTVVADYSAVEFPVGFRYYSFLKGGSKIFLNVFFVPNLTAQSSNSNVVYSTTYRNVVGPGTSTRTDALLNVRPDVILGAGIGYSGRALSVEARYYGTANLLTDYSYFDGDYKRFAIIVACRFLSIKN